MTVNHLDLGFNTPSSWAFYVPGISQPLFDLANKHTGFVVQSDFQLDSAPTGLVSSSSHQLEIWADVLGNRVYEDTISFSASGSKSYQELSPGASQSADQSPMERISTRTSAIRCFSTALVERPMWTPTC